MKNILITFMIMVVVMSFMVNKNVTTKTSKFRMKPTYKSIKVVATYYNPVSSQCDSDPLITASNDKINLNKLKKGNVRWIACSRDLLKRWGGSINYGDTIRVISKNKNVVGIWIAKDSMNKRYTKRIDFLCYDKIVGDLSDVEIQKIS